MTGASLAAARAELEERCASAPVVRAGRVWLVTAPPAGRSMRTPGNSRLGDFNKDVAELAGRRGAKVLPVFDVFRSALRRQRRWPARANLADDAGRLTPHGSYLMALVLLDSFSLP